MVISKKSDSEIEYDPAKYHKDAAKRLKLTNYQYEKVFDETASQLDVHEGVTRGMAEKFREGRNQLPLLEGVSAGGKTYTLFGENEKKNGLLHLLVDDLLTRNKERLLVAHSNDKNYALEGAYYFIYKDTYVQK